MARYEKNRFGSIVLTDELGTKFTITKKEQKELKTYVKRANQRAYDKVNKYYDMVKNQANMKGISKEAYKNLLEKKGFITEKYSGAFNQFKSKNEFKHFMKELKTVTKRGYGYDKIDKIRETMIKRVNENYGELGNNINEKLSKLKDSELLSLYVNNDDLIRDIYGSDTTINVVEELATKTESDIDLASRRI